MGKQLNVFQQAQFPTYTINLQFPEFYLTIDITNLLLYLVMSGYDSWQSSVCVCIENNNPKTNLFGPNKIRVWWATHHLLIINKHHEFFGYFLSCSLDNF